jgi:tRNA modification GTPase
MVWDNHTIIALSTPPGRGGIAVVRLSGPDALRIALTIFALPDGRSLSSPASHKAVHGFIIDRNSGEWVDEVMLTPMLAPNSYTGQDVVEISCHGGPGPVEAVINLCLQAGARAAGPGEFTRRAFLSGRIDLAQAEAVADLIEAQARAGASAAMEQLRGRLSAEIAALSGCLTECLALMEASIDFPEEDLSLPQAAGLKGHIESAREKAKELLATHHKGRLAREGVKVVIAGKPNAGKSSLLNALLEEERAIVTPVPGTTRDSIQETLIIEGVSFRLTDTAGIRSTVEIVEKMGVDRTLKLLEEADLCLLLLDSSRELDGDDRMAMEATAGLKRLTLISKTDLTPCWDPRQAIPDALKEEPIAISVREGRGLVELKESMARCVGWGPPEGAIITRARHRDALADTVEALSRALKAMEDGYSPEFPAADLYEARSRLDSILGAGCSEDVLDRIFEQFCIGK